MDGGPDRPVVTGHPVGGRTACKRCKESVHRNLNTAWKSAKCDPGQEMCSLSVQNPKKVCTKFFRPRHHKKSALSATPLRKVCTKFEMVILYVIGPMSKKNVQKIFIKDAKICQFKKNMPQQQNAKNKYPIHDANFAKKEMQKYAKIFKKIAEDVQFINLQTEAVAAAATVTHCGPGGHRAQLQSSTP